MVGVPIVSFYEKMGSGQGQDSETHLCGERRRKKKEKGWRKGKGEKNGEEEKGKKK